MPENAVEKPWRLSFWSLIATQFQGAFSDNAYKYLLIFLISASALTSDQRNWFILIIGLLFSLPFILFSMTGGHFADRFSKRDVTIGTKIAEIFVMLVALAGLASHNLSVQLTAIFLLSTQAAVFGPSKYGLLPELLPEKLLSWGNGIIELGTFLAIITGTLAGANMATAARDRPAISGAILVGLAIIGLITSFGIRRVPPADPAKKFSFLGNFPATVRSIAGDRVLLMAVIGNTYFFFLAALLQFNIVIYGADVLHITEKQNGYLQAALAVGVGLGSVAAGYLSGHKIEYGLVPLGSLGITFFGLLLYRPDLSLNSIAVNLALLGFFSGFFIVPINALIQHRPDSKNKGGVIAAANLLSFFGIFLSSGVYFVMTTAGLTPRGVFLYSGLLTLAATAYILVLMPDSLLRLLLWILTHTFYGIRIEGRENIPGKGGALFVSNHLSFVDALLLLASTDRHIRFIMFKDFYDHPLIKPFARIMNAIPISSKLRPRDLIRSLKNASESIQAGRVVCIFAEGQITRIGQLLPFRRGMERIMKGVEAPIIPVNLDGVWGSIFSFDRGRFLWKLPRRPLTPVTVSFGRAMPPESSAFDVRSAVQQLQTEAYGHRKKWMKTLHRRFVQSARRHPLRFAMADARVTKLRAGTALTRTIFLARRLVKSWRGQRMVGILLPPSVPGALVNFAALLTGRIPVNLNYTVSAETMASCARQCDLKTVVTSRAFLEKVPLQVPGETLLLEDLAADPGILEKLTAFMMTWTLSAGLLEKMLGTTQAPGIDDLATVIFSSGSTGDPKGVMLTHYNIGSNVEQLGQIFALDGADRVLGILPFFHSFGFTGTFALPLALGVGVVYHPNPLDAQAIGGLVAKYRVTFLLATPTFLQGYVRRCSPEDFGSLDYVLVGAEKLHDLAAQSFEDRFGIRPLEAYGCTECAPAVTVNTRDFRAAGFRQVGGKRGRIGHPLPGVSVRIVDPETRAPLPIGSPGLLLVSGPNVMKGYLGRPEQTADVLQEGWYTTGDIAAVDEDGFLAITDRMSRFSKIGGEMVPHIKIEEKLQELAGESEQTFAVAGVPDEKKGERLVVIHTLPQERILECIDRLAQSGLPNLWLPRANAFFRVEAIPCLGTGKMDQRKIHELALKFSESNLKP